MLHSIALFVAVATAVASGLVFVADLASHLRIGMPYLPGAAPVLCGLSVAAIVLLT